MKSELELVEEARMVEVATWYPDGREFDGCPYQAAEDLYPGLLDFLSDAFKHFGGLKEVKTMIRERKKEEELADHFCANWILWTVLNEFEVSRVRK